MTVFLSTGRNHLGFFLNPQNSKECDLCENNWRLTTAFFMKKSDEYFFLRTVFKIILDKKNTCFEVEISDRTFSLEQNFRPSKILGNISKSRIPQDLGAFGQSATPVRSQATGKNSGSKTFFDLGNFWPFRHSFRLCHRAGRWARQSFPGCESDINGRTGQPDRCLCWQVDSQPSATKLAAQIYYCCI